ncbi:MAG: response regulator [Candidatus Cloacimonetes bacterium]|nr:response regulator [Candidatus Cloacimonadota bacterium]
MNEINILEDLKLQYYHTKLEKVKRIKKICEHLLVVKSLEAANDLKKEMHKIAGNAGSYGFDTLSKIAREMEILLEKQIRLNDISLFNKEFLNQFLYQFANAFEESRTPTISQVESSDNEQLIMIIDDDFDVVKFEQVILKEAGITSIHVHEPLEVIEKLYQYKPALLVLDIEMPHINGIRLLKMIREKSEFKQIKVIINTAMDKTVIEKALSDMSVLQIMNKPVNPEEFLSLVFNSLNDKQNISVIKAPLESRKENFLKSIIEPDQPLILIVDDDKDFTKILSIAFDNRKFNYLIFYEGSQAIDYLTQPLEKSIDLIILDRQLQDTDGLQILASIPQEIKKKTPVIFLTSKTTEEDILMGLKAGAFDYLFKPFSLSVFLEKLNKYLSIQFKK